MLREKVRANYTLFLDASEGIQNVGNDMISLKELIVKTQSLVEVSQFCISFYVQFSL